jgi:hypothetical protein
MNTPWCTQGYKEPNMPKQNKQTTFVNNNKILLFKQITFFNINKIIFCNQSHALEQKVKGTLVRLNIVLVQHQALMFFPYQIWVVLLSPSPSHAPYS